MKNKYLWSCIIVIALLLHSLNSISFCIHKSNFDKESLMINNINDKDIKIEIKNAETINSVINLDEIYKTYSIITMDITNTGLDYVELSNINCSIYQNDKKLQTFIQSDNEYLGFVGVLLSGDKKEIKIGVALEDRNSPLEIVFENLSDTKKEKKTKVINI